MTDFELVAYPVKKIKVKLQLVGGSQSFFPGLRKYVLWDEYNQTLWEEVVEKTWKQFGEREQGETELSVIQEMDGDVVSLSQSIDATSDVRRTMSASIHLNNPKYFEAAFSAIWLNRLIRVQFGIYDIDEEDYRWFPIGDYMVTLNDYMYNAQTNQLNLSLADLMASITEHRGNQIGTEVTIYMDTPMKEAINGTIERFFPFTFNNVTDFEEEKIPYDLEFERGIYPYDIVKKIVTLYPGYEQYYTADGVYAVQSVPMGISEGLVLDADQMAQLVISDNGSSNPQDIKNTVEVWGRELDADHTAETCDSTLREKTYSLYIDELFDALVDGMTFSFTPDKTSQIGQMIKIQDTPAYPIVIESGDGDKVNVQWGDLKEGTQYVVKYTNFTYVLQGPSIIHAMYFLFSERPDDKIIAALKSKYGCQDIGIMIHRDSQFTIDWIGERVLVCDGGEYEDIYTTKLALERASYETWKRARVQDTIRLEMLYVPWLDVNQKVRYKSIVTDEEADYLVQSIQVNVETFTMYVSLTRYYPYYPWLRGSTKWEDYGETSWSELSGLYWDEIMYPVKTE